MDEGMNRMQPFVFDHSVHSLVHSVPSVQNQNVRPAKSLTAAQPAAGASGAQTAATAER